MIDSSEDDGVGLEEDVENGVWGVERSEWKLCLGGMDGTYMRSSSTGR
jgi:hypothetical protein